MFAPEPSSPTTIDAAGPNSDYHGSPASGMLPPGAMRILAIGVAELVAIVVIWRLFSWNLPLLLAVHALALAALGHNLRTCRLRGEDASLPFLALLASFAVGPAGAIGAGCLDVLVRLNEGQGRLLADWYERISLATAVDPVTRHCDNVGVGRAMNLTAGSPVSFLAAIESGTLAQRQTILGIVARRFHADYLPVLQAALKSSEPLIRVQAAAVASHVRPDVSRLYKATIAELPAATTDPVKALDLLQRLQAMTASGLLDESDRLQGLTESADLGDSVLSGFALHAAAQPASGNNAALEQLLLTRRRFADLRVYRSARRALHGRPRARIRRLGKAVMGSPDAAMAREMGA